MTMHFDASNPNMRVWLREEPTDPNHTKKFTKGGGFSGTAINATYTRKRLTDAFGPVGLGWGVTVLEFRDVHLQGGPSLNFAHIKFWYYPNGCKEIDGVLQTIGERASFDQVGGTELGGTRKSGAAFGDDEAYKKSLTDALSKAASEIGIAADVHLGLFDDNKYVNDRMAQEGGNTKAVTDVNNAEAKAETKRQAEAILQRLDDCANETEFMAISADALRLRPALVQHGLPETDDIRAALTATKTRIASAKAA